MTSGSQDAVFGFHNNGDGAVVDESDVHHGAELSILDGDSKGFERFSEFAVHGVGFGGGHGGCECGAVSVARLCAEGKLADEEYFALNIQDGEVHFVVFVGKDPQF